MMRTVASVLLFSALVANSFAQEATTPASLREDAITEFEGRGQADFRTN